MNAKINEEDIRFKENGLESEIRDFEKERENIRRIIGRIGGIPTRRTRIANVFFAILVIAAFAMSIVFGGRMRFFMIETGIFLLSIKLIYFLESYMRLNHFQFWILSSLEWRLDKMNKMIKQLKNDIENKNDKGGE